MLKPSISLIGAGAAGSAMLLALYRLGYPVAGVSSRTLESARRCAALVGTDCAETDNQAISGRGDIVIIATPDNQIASVCASIASQQGFRRGQLVLHLSGALASSELASAADAGADICALHPIQTLVDPAHGAELLRSAWFCLEGNSSGIKRAHQLAEALSAKAFTLEAEQKALYHAALCVSSNYLIALENIAVDMLTEAGLERSKALQALLPLIRGAADNLAQSGLPSALTGPISRGDAGTVAKHLQVLEESGSRHTELYLQLGRVALDLAREKGALTHSAEQQLECLLQN